MWIRSDTDLSTHPKLKKLTKILGITRRDAVGLVHLLWHWACKYAPEGDLRRYAADDIANAVDWEGDPNTLIDALLGCGNGGGPGFLEEGDKGTWFLHDWEDYQSRTVAEKKRQRRYRENKRNEEADVTSRPRRADVAVTSQTRNTTVAAMPHDTTRHDHDDDISRSTIGDSSSSLPGGAGGDTSRPRDSHVADPQESMLIGELGKLGFVDANEVLADYGLEIVNAALDWLETLDPQPVNPGALVRKVIKSGMIPGDKEAEGVNKYFTGKYGHIARHWQEHPDDVPEIRKGKGAKGKGNA